MLVVVEFFGFAREAAEDGPDVLGLLGGPASLAGYTHLKFEETRSAIVPAGRWL
jgi:hypothetical protein